MTAEIEELLKATIGLDAASVGRPMIEHAVRARMTVRGTKNMENYCEELRSSDAEMRELIETVVVPETSFFRDRESFHALARVVLKELSPSHPNGVLRILSAPCSTGEEPYSIAMALLDAGLAADRFQIDAVDISARALALAKQASYGRNSFRNNDLAFRDRYFRASKDRYELATPVAAQVGFAQGNLLAADFLAGKSFDIIFCRNVLIYFDAPTQAQVIQTLDRLLAQDGFLFVGPSEAFVVRGKGFTSANHAQAFVYRRSHAPREVATVRPPRSRKKSEAPVKAKPVVKAKREMPAEIVPVNLENACRLADAGCLAEAVAACETHLREQGATAAGYYLLGLLRDSLGDESQAAALYRKTLYLEPNHVEALTHLSLLAGKTGDAPGAKRLQLRAERAQQNSRTISEGNIART